MAVLKKAGSGIKKFAGKVADFGGNVVASVSGLSSAQLEKVEEKRKAYFSEKPENDEESIKRHLGSYAVEAYEAYLPLLRTLYKPMSLGETNDETNLKNRIRYFEVTRWVTDPNEDNIDKLTNVYHVLSADKCNIALIFNRKRTGTKVYMAVVSNIANSSPWVANNLSERLKASLSGNFPGVEIKESGVIGYGAGIIPELKDTHNASVAVVSNIASEKSEHFISQSIEKLLDGIVPKKAGDDYTVVLLATPIKEQLERKNALSDLYSRLAPYSAWQQSFTFTETTAVGSSSTLGAALGGSVGSQQSQTTSSGENSSHTDGTSEGGSSTENESTSTTETTGTSSTESESSSRSESETHSHSNSTSFSQSKTDSLGESINGTVTPFGIGGGASINANHAVTNQIGTAMNDAISNTISNSSSIGKAVTETASTATGIVKGTARTISKLENTADTIGRMTVNAIGAATNLGLNFGLNFARSSSVTVLLGKNDTLTQSFINYDVKNTLELIEKQIKRIEQSTALGMWDFAAYFISENQSIAANAANMYLSLTQGEDSYLSRSAVNLWGNNPDSKESISRMTEFIKRLQHPEFELDLPDDEYDPDWLMYPAHVNPTVMLTGRELAHSLNMPKKSVSGLPVLECAAFGREVQRFTVSAPDHEDFVYAGNIYHMHKQEDIKVKLDNDSLCMHTFVTGSTGAGKSNFIYNLLYQLRDEDKHFLVIEPAKGEYKNIFGGYEDVSVYGTNPVLTRMLHINPFSFPESINVFEHIDRLVEIFNACWPMYAAMPAVLKESIEKAYQDKGWILSDPAFHSKIFPTFADLLKALPQVIDNSSYSKDTKSDYAGALITRVKSLTNGINSEVFCSDNEISNKALFDENVIVDISRVGSTETKSLIMGILVMKLQEYRMHSGRMNSPLKHVTVIEEAHNLLRRTSLAQSQESSNLQGKSVEMLTNSIAEMRTYGEGFIIADQAPYLLDEAVIRNTNTKVIFRLPDEDDCMLAGKSAALTDEQIREIARLPAFVAVIHQSDWIEAVLCKTSKFDEAREYHYTYSPVIIPVNEFMHNLFSTDERTDLSAEKKKLIEGWIDRLENGSNTKSLLKKSLIGETLSEKERYTVAYNVFSGEKASKIFDNRTAMDVAVEEIRHIVSAKLTDREDSDLIDLIVKNIFIAYRSEEELSDKINKNVLEKLTGGYII